jgi:hypothetical protein
MLTIETIVTVNEDGTIVTKAPTSVPRGQYRAVIVLDDAPVERAPDSQNHPGFPDLAAFRASLGVAVYPGNTVVDMREEERS